MHKKSVIKRKLKFEIYENCLEATQLDNKINNHKEFIKNNKLILNTHQRFKSERYNVFTEEVNKIILGSNDHKRMRSIDSIETYAYRTSEDLVSKKEEIKCNNIIKRYKKN